MPLGCVCNRIANVNLSYLKLITSNYCVGRPYIYIYMYVRANWEKPCPLAQLQLTCMQHYHIDKFCNRHANCLDCYLLFLMAPNITPPPTPHPAFKGHHIKEMTLSGHCPYYIVSINNGFRNRGSMQSSFQVSKDERQAKSFTRGVHDFNELFRT